MSLTSTWANVKNETEVSARFKHHLSNSAARTAINWSYIIIGKGQLESQLWFPGKMPLDYAREAGKTEMVNLLMGKASWLHGWGSVQWPNGIVGGNIHGWNMVKLLALVGMKTWKAYQGCLRIRCWTHDSWSLKTHCQIITSHRPTGQQLSTGEPRIWLNLQNWFVTQHGIIFVWNAMPPIQFLSPSRTNQIIRWSTDRKGMLFLAFDYLQQYMAA